MPKSKYKKKPESWYCIQYTGTNAAEMTEFCYLCTYESGKLYFNIDILVNPDDWVLQDQAGRFSMMNDQQFNAFFQLEGGPAG